MNAYLITTAFGSEHLTADTVQLRDDGHLVIRKGDQIIAIYAPGSWKTFYASAAA